LQKEKDKELILEGANILQEMALKAHRQEAQWERLMIEDLKTSSN
jgi:hypothetical protein